MQRTRLTAGRRSSALDGGGNRWRTVLTCSPPTEPTPGAFPEIATTIPDGESRSPGSSSTESRTSSALNVAWKNSAWRELKFVAGKEAAIRLFEGRRPVLTAVVGRRIRAGVIDAFVNTIRGWSGDYLLMDPEEVLGELGDDEERDFESFSRILVAIDSGDLEAVLATAGRYVGELREDSDKCLVNIVGYTYW